MSKTIIWWLRRDLRLYDNDALTLALREAAVVIPLFILDPLLLNSNYVGEKRLAFLYGALRSLDSDLRERGSRLVVRRGQPTLILPEIVSETAASSVLAERDFSTYARRRDKALAQVVPLLLVGGPTIHPPGSVLKDDGTPYVVYTPFRNKWQGVPLPQREELLPVPESMVTPEDIRSDSIPESPILPDEVPFLPSTKEAIRRLKAFTEEKVYVYDEERDRMDLAGTSQLSAYLRFGLVSARATAVAAIEAIRQAEGDEARENAQVWLSELIWRDFYIHILYHFPHVSRRSFREKWQTIEWKNDVDEFEAWCNGRTGYPVVDAAMRQLLQTGWMHNRARMIVASFLVKDLLIDWRWGERWFMQQLVDGDPAANNGGWQWTAGTGTDAAPYFRIFNPITQGKKFDPNGRYIRRWLPELRGVEEDKYVHEPWRMPSDYQHEIDCVIGEDYPQPIVDHKVARQKTLAAYKRAKGE